MNRTLIHLTDPWTGRDVTRDVTGLSRARLERYARVVRSAEFRRLEAESGAADPGALLAAWVAQVGPERAGVALLRRRVAWLNAGAALGLLLGAFVLGWLVAVVLWLPQHLASGAGDRNIIDLLRADLQAGVPPLAATLLTWLALAVFFVAPILLGLLLGAGAGWFVAGLIDAWERSRAPAQR
ncbi:MAG TPA: hypothetical protein VNE59_05625 [Burkholderiales bacterium]|nr:hypothetical protein [Burkholderiales bacterium]